MQQPISSPSWSSATIRLGVRRVFPAAIGALLLGSAGCYRPYYYAPPMPTYQGPVAPIQTLTPGPSYIPGQAPAGGLQPIPANSDLGTSSDSPFFPTNPEQTAPSNPQPTFGDPNQPIYNPSPSTGDNLVPDYGEPPGDFQNPLITPGGDGGVQEFKVPASDPQAMFDLNPAAPKPSGPTASTSVTVEPISVEPQPEVPSAFDPLGGDPLAIDPLGIDPLGSTATRVDPDIEQASYMPKTVGATTLDPYAFEEGTYAWLRGVVHQDPEDGSWTITYDLTPSEFDDFAGHLTLANDGRLQGLKDNDVVLIEGELSPLTADRFGKPVYEISEIIPLDVSVQE